MTDGIVDWIALGPSWIYSTPVSRVLHTKPPCVWSMLEIWKPIISPQSNVANRSKSVSLFLIVPDWNVSGDIRRRASAIIQPEILLLSKRPVSWIESHLTHLCRLDWNWNPSWNSEMWPFNPPQRRISHLSATASRERILKNPPKNLWLGWVMVGVGRGWEGRCPECWRLLRSLQSNDFSIRIPPSLEKIGQGLEPIPWPSAGESHLQRAFSSTFNDNPERNPGESQKQRCHGVPNCGWKWRDSMR